MSSSVMGILMIFLLGTGSGLPLGLPPGPEDPVMSRVAPEQCLAYLSWSGVAAPDPDSPNQTEQLLAEKEVQMLVSELQRRIVASMLREAEDDPQGAAIIKDLSTVVKTVLVSPTAVFVSKASMGPQGPELVGGAVVNLGDQADAVQKALSSIEQTTLGQASDPPAGEKPWRTLPVPPGMPPVEWDVKNRYLIIGIGPGEADRIYARARSEAPEWLVRIRTQLAVPRQANIVYFDVAGITASAAPLLDADAASTIKGLGLDKVRYVASVTGLDQTGCTSRILVATDGTEPTGLLKLLGAEPLSRADLAAIPKDATLAMAVKLDLAKAYQAVLEMLGNVDPEMRTDFADEMAYIEEDLGFSLSKDVFAALGDVWRVYNAPGEGMVFTGLVAVVDVRDRERLEAVNRKLIDMVRAAERPPSDREFFYSSATIEPFEFEGQKVYFVKPKGYARGPFAPAWCITDRELVFGAYPHNVKSYLTRRAAAPRAGSLADVPAVAALLAEDRVPVALSYQDAAEAFKTIYPMVQMFASFAFGQAQREGIDLDVSILPSGASIIRHLRPATVAVRRTDAGVLVESHQILPLGGGGEAVAMPLLLFGGAASSVNLSGLRTRQLISSNNLKQIGLAFHNYHDATRAFPAAGAPLKEGNPPVSWRVRVLPYVEESALHDQYRFDEPWDSENNTKLLAKMPSVYKAPGSKVAKDGKTNYLAVVGKGNALSLKEPTRIDKILDGTSNTILVVEADDSKAVPWTKPEDFTPDDKNPMAGLVGLRRRGFLALFCDGSVRLISNKTAAETLKALFTRDGGEVVDPDALDGSRRTRRRDVEMEIETALEKVPAVEEPKDEPAAKEPEERPAVKE